MSLIIIYLVIAIVLYLLSVLSDFILYMKGVVTSYPIQGYKTHRLLIVLSLLWLPVMLGILYAAWFHND